MSDTPKSSVNGRLLIALLVIALSRTLFGQDAASAAVPLDPRDIVRRTFANLDASNRKARDYTYLQHTDMRELDGKGAVKRTRSTLAEVMVIYDQNIERVIERDGKPLDAKEQAKQDERINKLMRERESETEEQKQQRIAKYEKARAEQQAFITEVADAFDFRMAPDEIVEGRPVYVLDAEPRPSFQPRSDSGKLLRKFRGRLWIDKSELNLVKVEAEVVDTVAFRWFLARIARGSRLQLELTRVNDEVWLPRHMAIRADARVLLLKRFNFDVDATFRDYKKFRTDTKVIPLGEAPPQ